MDDPIIAALLLVDRDVADKRTRELVYLFHTRLFQYNYSSMSRTARTTGTLPHW